MAQKRLETQKKRTKKQQKRARVANAKKNTTFEPNLLPFRWNFFSFYGYRPPQAGKILHTLKLATHLSWPPGQKNSVTLKLAGQLKGRLHVQLLMPFFFIKNKGINLNRATDVGMPSDQNCHQTMPS